MKAMRQPRLTSLLLAAAVAAMLPATTAQALTVSNIRTAQRANDGAIIVTYDLSATNACEVAVTFKAGGTSLAARTLSGDVGPGVAAGTDKSIVWDAPSDLPMTVVADAVATVTAYGSPIPEEGVQLWENGPYWAECNVGAEHSWDFGLFFWWGDTTGYTYDGRRWVAGDGSGNDYYYIYWSCPTYGKDNAALRSGGWTDSDDVLLPAHDAARALLGGAWRMPSQDEIQGLADNCAWTRISTNGVNGFLVEGRGDFAAAAIFLPAAGFGIADDLLGAGSDGYYWSSVPDGDGTNDAKNLYFSQGNQLSPGSHWTTAGSRRNAFTVRPVLSPAVNDSSSSVAFSFRTFNVGVVDGIGGWYAAGATATITALHKKGWAFDFWSGSAEDLALLSDTNASPATFTMPERDVSFTANYRALPYVSNVTVTQRPGDGRVVVTYDLAAENDCAVDVSFSAGGTELPARTLAGDAGTGVAAGTGRQIVWNAPVDLPGVVVSGITAAVTAMDSRDPLLDGVRLWEGGPRFALMNVGAANALDYGLYFWWGDTTGYRLEGNAWVASDGTAAGFSFGNATTPTYGKDNAALREEGWTDEDNVLLPAHDAARVHWGGPWRMPTDSELQAMIDRCTCVRATTNGVDGCLVTGKGDFAGASIFLPSAGSAYETHTSGHTYIAEYWSSVPSAGNPNSSRVFRLNTIRNTIDMGDRGRSYGIVVRAVRGDAPAGATEPYTPSFIRSFGAGADGGPFDLDTRPYSFELTVTGGTGGGVYGQGAAVPVSATGSRPGYSVLWTATAGSLADAGAPSTVFTMPACDAEVSAAWSANEYVVAFHSNPWDGAVVVTNLPADAVEGWLAQPFRYDAARELNANVFEIAGFTFLGWADSPAGTVLYSDQQTVSNLTTEAGAQVRLYAVWLASGLPDGIVDDGRTLPTDWLYGYGLLAGVTDETALRDRWHSNGANGQPLWKNYVAGVAPTASESNFLARIEIVGGGPVISWEPDLGPLREYTVKGKTNLSDSVWIPTNSLPDISGLRFFRVWVELK